MSTVPVEFHLVVGCKVDQFGRYSKPSIRTTKQKPDTEAHEIAVAMRLELPLSLFKKPTLKATLKVSEGQSAPLEITPEIASNIAQVVREQLGITLQVSAPESQ